MSTAILSAGAMLRVPSACAHTKSRRAPARAPVAVVQQSDRVQPSSRRHVLGVGVVALATTFFLKGAPRAVAMERWSDGMRGIESIELPKVSTPGAEMFAEWKEERNSKDEALDAEFAESDYLKDLLAKTESKKKQRKIELENKYCRRGAEYGYGDCAGFKFDADGKIITE